MGLTVPRRARRPDPGYYADGTRGYPDSPAHPFAPARSRGFRLVPGVPGARACRLTAGTGLQPVPQDKVSGEHDGQGRQHEEHG